MKNLLIGLSAAAMAAAPLGAQAANLVQNGGFELTSAGKGQLSYNTSATGWTLAAPNASYTFLFTPGSADTSGATGQYGFLALWGPGNGAANGLPATSPAGGNFIASDPSFQNAQPGLSQTISGLTPGKDYELSFYWAGAQQLYFDGPTWEGWDVTFGGQTKSTTTVFIPNHGFSGWMQETMVFTASNATQVLSFFSTGGPNAGVPPFALLDGVSLTTVPEPGTWALMIGGFGLAGAALRRRRAAVGA